MKFADILKGLGQYFTVEGRDQAQNLKNIMLASKVKRIRPEDFESLDAYNKALAKSNTAHQGLQSELSDPSANRILNQIFGISEEAQKRQGGEQLYGYDKANPQGKVISPTMIKDTMTLASKAPSAQGLGLLGTLIAGGTSAGLAGGGMSTQGNEIRDALTAIPFGVAGAGLAYGAGKLGSSLAGKIKAPKPASDAFTKSLNLKKADIKELGGWTGAKEFATEFADDAKTYGIDITNRYSKAESIPVIKNILSDQVEDALSRSQRVASANEVLTNISNNQTMKYLKTKDPRTFEYFMNMVAESADEGGNLSAVGIKKLIDTIQDIGGGFKNTTGDQSAVTKQILSSFRSGLRDQLDIIAPEASDLLSKWSKYIKVSPALESGAVTATKEIGPSLGVKIGGTLTTKASDTLENILSPKGQLESTVQQPSSILKGILGGIGQGAVPGAGALGGTMSTLMGGMGQQEQQMPSQLGEDDPGLMAIRSAFESQPQGMGGQSDKLKQALAIAVLSGDISSSDANAVISLLGMDEKDTSEKTALLGNSISEMERLYGAGTEGSLSRGDKSTGLGGLTSGLGNVFKKGFNQDFVDRLTAYNQQKALAAGIINKAREAGTLNEGEYEVMIANMPSERSTEAQAKAWFDNVRRLLVQGGASTSYTDESDVLRTLGLQ